MPKSEAKQLFQKFKCLIDVKSKSKELQKLIEANGGKIVATFSPSITHLVFDEGKPSIYKKAKEANIRIIKPDYFTKCLESNQVLEEKDFIPELELEQSNPSEKPSPDSKPRSKSPAKEPTSKRTRSSSPNKKEKAPAKKSRSKSPNKSKSDEEDEDYDDKQEQKEKAPTRKSRSKSPNKSKISKSKSDDDDEKEEEHIEKAPAKRSRSKSPNKSKKSKSSDNDDNQEIKDDKEEEKSKRKKESTKKPKTESKKKETKKSIKHILISGCHTEEIEKIKTAVKKLDDVVVSNRYGPSVTHIILGDDHRRTIKVMQGIIDGKWIVTMNWILDSAKHKKWLDESSYEEFKRFPGSKKSREIHISDSTHKLFDGKKFYIYGDTDPSRAELEKLLGALGGKITTASKADIVLKGEVEVEEELESKGSVVKLEYLFESIAQYEVQKEKKYLVKD